jgi:hypothetical protein
MDFFNQILEFAKANPLVLVIAYFLFKDKLDPLLAKILGGGSQPAPAQAPGIPVVTKPEDRPILDAIMQLLPVVIPIILAQVEKSKAKE